MSERMTLRWSSVVLLGLVAATSAAAVLGFRAVFADWSFVVAAVLGAAGAALVVALAWWQRWLVGETIASSVVGLALIGAVAANGVPTPDAFRSVLDGLTLGWADVLSRTPPIDVTPELRMLPFALAWLGTTLGGELLRRTRPPALPAVGPLIALSVSVLVTAEDRTIGIAQGAIIGLAALVVGVSQVRVRDAAPRSLDADGDDDDVDRTARARRRRATARMLRAGVAIAVIGAIAPIVGPRLPLAEANDRFDLRDRNDPPWDPLSVPSPLVGIKSSLKTSNAEQVVFSVESAQPIGRWSLAVMGEYDGVVWSVASQDDADAVAEFRPVGTQLPDPDPAVVAPAESVSATVQIESLRGPWVPMPGWPSELMFDVTDASAAQPGDRLRMNLTTGTLAVPAGVSSGVRYQVDALVRDAPDDADLSVTVADLQDADEVDLIPPSVRNLAADLLEGIDPGWDQVVAVRDRFVSEGFYDTSPASRPGHSYFRLAEFLSDPDQLVGYEEQYAAAAASISRLAGLPTRVVVGYVVPPARYEGGRTDVLAGDISAWIEIDAGPDGWIPVDVTPDRSREPVVEETGITIEDVAIPSPPPPPQIPPDLDVFANEEEPEEDEEEEDEDDEEEEVVAVGGLRRALIGAGAGAAGLVLLVPVLVAAWKARRRRRRRHLPDPADRVSFAWREVLDRYDEAGVALAPRATPTETLRTLVAEEPAAHDMSAELKSMVAVVDRAAFHADPPPPEAAQAAWHYHDHVVGALREHRSAWRRAVMSANPKTLRRRRRVSTSRPLGTREAIS